jgi:selenocysteine-specific elongation factor
MFTVATAGHVDHGKSALVQALTGMQPDRWAEERRRGLTIDLGFAWTTLASGRKLAFVDVPGHQRFLGNALAGLGPAGVVCFVVAADRGWQAQSSDHRDVIAALGISHGVIALTRTDLAASDRVGDVLARARAELAATGLRDAPAIPVSALHGTGLTELRAALDGVLDRVAPSRPTGRVRLWLDRSFTIGGAGTVVTGTLTAGTLHRGDRLQLLGPGQSQEVTVRGLQSCGLAYPEVQPTTRVAVNLRGVAAGDVHRGAALATPGEWLCTRAVDVHRSTGVPFSDAPGQLTARIGTAAVPARLRRFDDDHARLTLEHPLPLELSDRLVLHDPGGRRVLGGVQVLDADPPALRRRGDSARALARMAAGADVASAVASRGAISERQLRLLGYDCSQTPADVRVHDGWWVHAPTYDGWRRRLRAAVCELHQRNPLADGLSRGAARDLLGLPDEALLDRVVPEAELEQCAGRIRLPGSRSDLGLAEEAVAELERRLAAEPFRAPEADELAALHLGVRELAAAGRAGRLLRLTDAVVLLPTAPALAMRELAQLTQPFTATQAKQALGTTRRVAIPLLEHLDARGWTRRIDAIRREVVH